MVPKILIILTILLVVFCIVWFVNSLVPIQAFGVWAKTLMFIALGTFVFIAISLKQ